MFFAVAVNCQELQTTMRIKDPTGEIVTVALDACYDPVTKHWGPCYVEFKENCKSKNNK